MENFRQFIYDKCVGFSVRVVRLAHYLQTEKNEYVLSKQIVRSGTSIGANLAEAQYGTSKRDFLAKCYIALKECAETCYRLEILVKTEYISQIEYQSLYDGCNELKKLFISITKTTKESLEIK